MNVVVNGLMTHYERRGSGPVVLLLHGWGDSQKTFANQSSLSDDFELISLDLPGFGDTETPKETFGLQEYARFVADFTSKIGISRVYAIIGHSNGGAIAIKACSHGLLRPNKLVLLASSGIRSEYRGKKKLLRITAKSMKYPTKVLPKRLQTSIKKRAYSAIGSDMFVAEKLQETFKRVISEDLQSQAVKVLCPSLLVYGTEDTATPVEYGQIFSDILPDSKLKILNGAGHFLHQTHSSEVNTLLAAFLGTKQ